MPGASTFVILALLCFLVPLRIGCEHAVVPGDSVYTVACIAWVPYAF